MSPLPETARRWLASAARSTDGTYGLPSRSAPGAAGEHTRALFDAGMVALWVDHGCNISVTLTPAGLALGLTLDVVPR